MTTNEVQGAQAQFVAPEVAQQQAAQEEVSLAAVVETSARTTERA